MYIYPLFVINFKFSKITGAEKIIGTKTKTAKKDDRYKTDKWHRKFDWYRNPDNLKITTFGPGHRKSRSLLAKPMTL